MRHLGDLEPVVLLLHCVALGTAHKHDGGFSFRFAKWGDGNHNYPAKSALKVSRLGAGPAWASMRTSSWSAEHSLHLVGCVGSMGHSCDVNTGDGTQCRPSDRLSLASLFEDDRAPVCQREGLDA